MMNETELSPYLEHSRSSKAPIYGLPAAVGSVFQIKNNLSAFIEKTCQEFQNSIRDIARPVWGEVADTIFVIFDPEIEGIRIFSLDPRAQELEYGGLGTPPIPILRNAANSAQTKFADKLSDLIYKETR